MVISYILALYSVVILVCCVLFPFIELSSSFFRRALKLLILSLILWACGTHIHEKYKIEPFIPENNPTVYVTDYGEAYHSRGCGYLWKSSNKTTLYEATLDRYYRCSRCDPPVFTDTEKSLIDSSLESKIPNFETFLTSKEYITYSFCTAVFTYCCFKFEIAEKLRKYGYIRLSKFLDYISISYCAFYLPGIISCFILFYIVASVATLIIVPIHSLISRKLQFPSRQNKASTIPSSNLHSTSSNTPPTSQVGEISHAQRLCEIIWNRTDAYVSNIDSTLNKQNQLYLWGIYFYVVVKTVKDQHFIDEVYSHFDTYAGKNIADPVLRKSVTDSLRNSYRKIRIPLNQSGIDPLTASGENDLWNFTCKYLYRENSPPSRAQSFFKNSVSFLKLMSKLHYSKSQRLSQVPIEKSSISSPVKESVLPNE